MNYTNDQLTQLIAKMLPETVVWTGYILCDNGGSEDEMSYGRQILDTERLHLCQLIERNHLTADEHHAFAKLVKVSDTWQQRTSALAEVKGVTL